MKRLNQGLTSMLLITALTGFAAAGWAGDMKGDQGMMQEDGKMQHATMPMKDEMKMEQQGMAMKAVVVPEILDHGSGNRNHPVMVSLALSDPEFVFRAENIVNGQIEALGESEPAAVDELDGGSVTTEPDVMEQVTDLLASKDRRELVVVLGLDLGKDRPVSVAELIDEEEFG